VKVERRRLVERSAPGPGRSPKADPRLGVVLYAGVEPLGLADAPPSDVTIVCGGPGWRAQARDAAMLAFLRSLDPLRVAYAPAL
jgi:hypothetical protein